MTDLFYPRKLNLIEALFFARKKKLNHSLHSITLKTNDTKVYKDESLHESIRYAKRIQDALMLKERHLQRLFPESFLLYQPKDIVSGDFYWFTKHAERNDKVIMAVADCTGHGIPGAFMSVLGINLLNQIVLEDQNHDPSSILQRLDYKLRKSFSNVSDNESGNTYDGMDIAICSIDYTNKLITFAGAFSRIIVSSNESIEEYKGSRYPIGGLQLEKERSFENTLIPFETGNNLYFFTDGFPDQFGGTNNKKFKSGMFKSLLNKNHKLSMDTQRREIERALNEWKGNKEQTDDITVMGMRL